MPLPRPIRLLAAALLSALALLLAMPAQAQQTNIAAELLAEGPARPSDTVTLAIHMTPGDSWHGYWLNPGDAGLGMTLDWTLPEGAKAGDPAYPVPSTLLISGLMNHVYKGDYAVLVPLTLPADAQPGARLPVDVDAQWLACTDEVCVPERARLQTTVAVGAPGRPDPRFDAWRERLPAPLGSEAHFAFTGNALRLAIPLPAALALDSPHVFLAQDKAAAYAAPQRFSRNGDVLVVELERPKFAPAEPGSLSGVLKLNAEGDGLSFAATPGEVPPAGEPLAAAGAPALSALPLLLLGALLGGLLLNIMPCVFPILSLKALSLARAGESEAHARIEGLAYAAGVIAACLALGGVLLALRAGGEEVGWAFQLQEPVVVAALLLLAAALTANFLGVFEFSAPGFTSEGSAQGAFATGLLAAFVATPCTGPFMAAAMGAALLLPVLPAMALFAALGLGIALPFLAIAFVPALRARLPKPGPWMTTFRRWMALPMGLTALALAWLVWKVGGGAFAAVVLAGGAVFLAALAAVGVRQRQGQSALVLALIAGLVAIGTLLDTPEPRVEESPAESLLAVQPFSEEALAKARASGKPVFAWFTADWCITCKVNEKVAIEREDTRAAFERAGVVVLRGDWTRRDPAITRYLTRHGAAGVPLYVWYPAGGGEPQVLPQVLTPSALVEQAGG